MQKIMHNTHANSISRMLIPALLCLSVLAACKKDRSNPSTPPATGSTTEKYADSLFLYAKDVYLWNAQLPEYDKFIPRQYVSSGDEEDGLNAELLALTKYATSGSTASGFWEYSAGGPKYSYIFNTDDSNPSPLAYSAADKSSVDLKGIGYDFGMRYGIGINTANTTFALYVIAVYPGSPAALAGIVRGDIITTLNGKTMSGVRYTDAISNYIDNATQNQAEVTLTVANKPAITKLSRTSYRSTPVLKSDVVTYNNTKVGYFAFARFDQLSTCKADIDEAFKKMKDAVVTNVIVDLRYNGGGYVETSAYLANLLAPSSENGKEMFIETFNETLQNKKSTLPFKDSDGKLQYQNGKLVTWGDVDFTKKGNTTNFNVGAVTASSKLENLQKIVFIVSGNTASASELLINVLKPSGIDIQLVGATTYGKPVGFAPVRIGKYDVYYSMFESLNRNKEGKYYDGMSVNYATQDRWAGDFGTDKDNYTYAAVQYLSTGSYPSNTTATLKGATSTSQLSPAHELGYSFKGMIEDRLKAK